MLSWTSFREKGRVGVVDLGRGLAVAIHGAVHSNTMLQAVELPAWIAHLDTGLANMNRNNLTHFYTEKSNSLLSKDGLTPIQIEWLILYHNILVRSLCPIWALDCHELRNHPWLAKSFGCICMSPFLSISVAKTNFFQQIGFHKHANPRFIKCLS